MKYRKKPVVIEAEQFTEENKENVFKLLGDTQAYEEMSIKGQLIIFTLEGNMAASPGDYIIKGVKGEFYPCKPDIFEATYDKVE
jgi:hypothetical protein